MNLPPHSGTSFHVNMARPRGARCLNSPQSVPNAHGLLQTGRPSHESQRGIALIITLIMLAVIAVVVMAFLAVSSRERRSVTDAGSQKDAELMAQTALERAKAHILFRVNHNVDGSQTNQAGGPVNNFLGPELTVSRSYPETNTWSPDIITNLGGVSPVGDFRDPRVPVLVSTNRGTIQDPLDFRYYLDLNRNGRPETNGFLPMFDEAGQPIGVDTFLVGDPEWIGLQADPTRSHSGRNRFLGRFAYLIQPAGRTLDANHIHNQAKTSCNMNAAPTTPRRDGFLRNQGFGSWELNLAAFLADLNANQWNQLAVYPYSYNSDFASLDGSTGSAFDDATDFLRYRYGGSVNNLATVMRIFGATGDSDFRSDGIDGYANGPGLTPPSGVPPSDNDLPTRPWPGANNPNRFSTVHDFFEKVGSGFAGRLSSTGMSNETSGRYTFYRMLDQLGTDSTPEPDHADPDKLIRYLRAQGPQDLPLGWLGKVNLNYDNIGQSSTNLLLWDPLKFFTNVANILLRSEFYFGVTNIPVFPTNEYAPSVHRLLQVAANLAEVAGGDPTNLFPLVFRPQFAPLPNVPDGWMISGYALDNNAATAAPNTNGIPYVIGAKKGLPNFNEYVQKTLVQWTRKVEIRRPETNLPPNVTNEMFFMSITNFAGLEIWNSYNSNYLTGSFEVSVSNVVRTYLTNEAHPYLPGASQPPWYTETILTTNVNYAAVPTWYFHGTPYNSGGFAVPLSNTVPILASMIYRPLWGTPGFELVGSTNSFQANNGQFFTPQWGLSISNELTFILSWNGKILDFVHLPHVDTYIDLNQEMMGENDPNGLTSDQLGQFWQTNRVGNSASLLAPTAGIMAQIDVSRNPSQLGLTGWEDANSETDDKNASAQVFNAFLSTNTAGNAELARQTPFNPVRRLVHTFHLQANDPMVHYTHGDLVDTTNDLRPEFPGYLYPPFTNHNLLRLNGRYRPWGGNPLREGDAAPDETDLAIKDPGMFRSDFWDFPTNKFPSIGWLGRIHRGTPWQTIYLKSEVAPEGTWALISVDPRTHPTNDWKLLDLFTVAPHPNASRGLLSINQTNIAAWSAALGGVVVWTNNGRPTGSAIELQEGIKVRDNLKDVVIDANSFELTNIVAGIARLHEQRMRQGLGPFIRVGQILEVPELTVKSPFIGWSDTPDLDRSYGLTDSTYERIPQQILSLLKVGEPRFVIYAFGQSLRPAPRSVLSDPAYFLLCTNYQVMGEVYTRTVARIEGTVRNPRFVIESFKLLPTD